MPKIIQLSAHVANLIAAGEVVERPASVVKELLENAVDAGATKVTVEIRNGGMTFLRVTDNGCGMHPDDAKTAFLRHATSKLKEAQDLAAIETMGFRGEALAAISSVSRIDLMTKTSETLMGVSLHLEAGHITEETEAGCPDGTTIIIRDLFFNTPARLKFMKSDSVEGSRVTGAVQLQALAHPGVSFTFIRDGKQVLATPGTGGLEAAVYSVYGRECAKMVKVDSRWDSYRLTGYVSKPTDARPSRTLQTFFVNGRPVRSKLLVAALEEAYRNQIMVGKFPACVLHLNIPADTVDVNVHPAKTEVKFLSEKSVFDCIHYGVLGALNKTSDRPAVYMQKPSSPGISAIVSSSTPKNASVPPASIPQPVKPQAFKAFATTVSTAPLPSPNAAVATMQKSELFHDATLRETVIIPKPAVKAAPPSSIVTAVANTPPSPAPSHPQKVPPITEPPVEQFSLDMPMVPSWRMVGELYRSYIIVEDGEDAFLIDKHAAHERILFDKLRANQQDIASQTLLTPVPLRLSPEAAAEIIANHTLLVELGFEIDEFGDNTVLLRQIPMDLSPDAAADAVESIASDLLNGRRENVSTVRDEVLHTVACKAAIKAGWHSDEKELLALVKQVMEREDLKYCPHGRPICISLSKKQLEKQFKRS